MTPARRDREAQKANDERERGRKLNEDKLTGFTLGCDDGNGDPAACNSLGEWFLLMRSDVISASRAFAPACFEKLHPQACLNIGRLLNSTGGKSALMAVQETLPQELKTEITGKALDSQTAILSEKAFFIGCSAGNADACSDGSRILLRSAAATAGSGGGGGSGGFGTSEASIKSLQRAEKLLRVGCDHSTAEGVSSAKCCASLGALYLSSASDSMVLSSSTSSLNDKSKQQKVDKANDLQGLSPLKLEAMELLRRGCEGEQAKACMQLAAIHRALGKQQEHNTSISSNNNNNNMKLAESYERKGLVWSGMTEVQADLHILKANEKRSGARGGSGLV
jgi:TPR repeat protein